LSATTGQLAPSARTASMYSLSRSSSTGPRMRRAKSGV